VGLRANGLGEFVSLSHGSTETYSSCVSPLPKYCMQQCYLPFISLLSVYSSYAILAQSLLSFEFHGTTSGSLKMIVCYSCSYVHSLRSLRNVIPVAMFKSLISMHVLKLIVPNVRYENANMCAPVKPYPG
jgi:hypothetical protein